MFRSRDSLRGLRVTFVMALLSLICSAFAGVSGSIFTSLPDGTTVNANLYDDPTFVYLNGGPQNLNASGLTDGVYYFQVTTPSGALLLSEDPATDRLVRVTGGRFAGRVHNDPPLFTLYTDPTGPPYPPIGPPVYPHPDGPLNSADGSVPVQLWPFDQTTNQGGEYKAWLISYDAATVDVDGVHLIFSDQDAKTDNFKIRETQPPVVTVANLAGHKFYDTNMDHMDAINGVPEGEVGVTNFIIHIELSDGQGNPVVLDPAPGAPVQNPAPGTYLVPTTSGGNWILPGVPSGTHYEVCEVLPAGDGHWLQTCPPAFPDNIPKDCFSRGYSGIVGLVDVIDLNFGNIEQGRFSGVKFYDQNMNGVQDPGELGVANVPIHIVVTEPDGSTATEDLLTGADGSYTSSYYPDGSTYVVTEGLTGNWTQTYPAGNGAETGTIGPGTPVPGLFQDYDVTYTIPDTTGKNFGNVQKGRVTGLKFYDTNMNGKLDDGELPVSGFHVDITFTEPDSTVVTEHLVTAADGTFASQYYPDGTTYSASEVLPAGWSQTVPGNNLYTGTISGGSGPYDFGTFTIPDVSLNFGNVLVAKLSGKKFYDKNMNGTLDGGEPGVGGFTITIHVTRPDGTTATETLTTAADGSFTSGAYPDGSTYSVSETIPAGSTWLATSGPLSGTLKAGSGPYTVDSSLSDVTGLNFGNILRAKIKGLKFYDKNMNGTYDNGESTVSSFPVKIVVTEPNGTVVTENLTTAADGTFTSALYPDGSTYVVTETIPAGSGWIQTAPAGGSFTGTVGGPQGPYTVGSTISDVTGLNFGNILEAKIKGVKFYDKNLNGVLDGGEAGVAGFTITIHVTRPDGTSATETLTTAADGSYTSALYPDGSTYTVSETIPVGSTWLETAGPYSGTIGGGSGPYSASSSISDVTDNFGNILRAKVKGMKFYDKNMNGTFDTGELPVSGFAIKLVVTKPDGTVVTENLTTAADGTFTSSLYPDGSTYTVSETIPGGSTWLETAGPFSGTIGGGSGPYTVGSTISDVVGKNFGNILQAKICGAKFYDKNMNGTFDGTESGVAGFTINLTVTKPNGTVVHETLTTDSSGKFTSSLYPDGSTYSINETLPSGWLQTAPGGNLYTGTIGGAQASYSVGSTISNVTGKNFGNILMASLSGDKFYDSNANGAFDSEPFIKGFKITIAWTKPNGTTGTDIVYTNAAGAFTVGPYPDGTTFKISEVLPPNPTGKVWVQSFPASKTYTGALSAGSGPYTVGSTITSQTTGYRFGNFLTGGSGALTIGYWSNNNGLASAKALGWTAVFNILNNSNLRNSDGTFATWPATQAGYTAYQSWVLGASATNMARMLSAQLSALELDVANGNVAGSAYIYAPGTASANALGYATITAIIAEAKASLGLYGNTTAAGAPRTAQTNLQVAIMNATNGSSTTGTVQPPVTIIVPSPY